MIMGKKKLSLLFLSLAGLLAVEASGSTLQFKVSEKTTDADSGRSLVFESKALGDVSFSVTGLGVIKSGELEEGATAEIRFKKDGIVQFRIGEGKNQESGVVPVRAEKQAWVLITGTAFVPRAEPSPPPVASGIEFAPLAQDEFHFKNPYGAAFDKLSTSEKIRMVLESPKTGELTRDERRNLLGFLHNQKGVEEANAGQVDAAEKSLRTAIDYMGEHDRVLSNLAYVSAVQGNNLALSGDLRNGEEKLTYALKLLEKTDNPNLKSQVDTALSGVYTKMGLDLPSTERRKKKRSSARLLNSTQGSTSRSSNWVRSPMPTMSSRRHWIFTRLRIGTPPNRRSPR